MWPFSSTGTTTRQAAVTPSVAMANSALFAHLPLPSKMGSLPAFVYGTAWKKDLTANLVHQALRNGFTAIDTACQPRHYREDLVGEGIRQYLNASPSVKRSDLFIQTKFTSVDGQDPNNIPYDPRASLTEQVHKSVETSLKHFTVSSTEEPYLDSLVLHSPMRTIHDTLEVWSTLETYVPDKIRNLGISNTNLSTLMELYERARIKPSVVQNRFYADTKYDIGLRKFCAERGIIYQSFWTLTANPNLFRSRVVQDLAQQLQIQPTGALYCLVLGLGHTTVLNGTKTEEHMRADCDAVQKAKTFAEKDGKSWDEIMRIFRSTIGERI